MHTKASLQNSIKCVFLFLSFFFGGCHSNKVARSPVPCFAVQSSPKIAMAEIPEKKPSPVPVKKVAKPLIVIDAGHGGEDFGTNAKAATKHQEKTLNLSCSFCLKTYLEDMGYRTIMTRTFDRFIPLSTRAEFSNVRNPDVFVSVHFNAAPSKQAEGVEVFFFEKDPIKKRIENSKRLAQSVLDQIILQTKARSRGIKHGNYAVIRETTATAILVEGGFLSNDKEFEKIKDPAYLRKVAHGIALGIDDYLKRRK